MTVEIAFALVTSAVLGLVAFAATAALFGTRAGTVVGGAAGLWRLIHVLGRFDRGRGLGR